MVDWIPTDPNAFLKDADALRQFGSVHDWQSEYAQWRHCYCPGISLFVGDQLGGQSTSAFQRLIKPLVPAAAEIIPSKLKSAIRPVQPDDWTKLPPDQIEDAYNNKAAMVFSKLVLLQTCMQIAIFRRTNENIAAIPPTLEKADPSGNPKPIISANPDFVSCLNSIEQITGANVFDRLKFHVACYAFSAHKREWWIENVVLKDSVLTSFAEFTRQKKKGLFPRSFANGGLCTVQTLKNIKAWRAQTFPSLPLGEIRYVDDDGTSGSEPKAAKQEVVVEEDGQRNN